MLLSANIQQIIVYVILAVVAIVLCQRLVRTFFKKKDSGVGCNCCNKGSCPMQKKERRGGCGDSGSLQ